MSVEGAPFYDDIAEAPAGWLCRWIKASDGVRLRAATWRVGEKGTVLLFPGRTEYIEKYGPAARELRRRGYAMATIDWRGQGLADRPLKDRMAGHVARFDHFQRDVAALVALAEAQELPRPFYLMAHSMGGAIGLRALYQRLPVRAAAFSAPMWGILIHPALRPAAWLLSSLSRPTRQDHQYAPGTSAISYVAEAPFADNVLTRDPGMYQLMQRQIAAHPDLALGGPTLGWLHEALIECRALRQKAAPAYPCYTALGSLERVVDAGPVHERMAGWLGGRLEIVPGAEHEVMMETPEIRAQFYDAACALFDKNR